LIHNTAHIHTHIQKTLFDKLNYPDTQVIYSTHSTHISEVSNVENVNILGRVDGRCEVFQPATGLTAEEVGTIQRYLDAVRSNLLFAKSVILVEGDAEEILIPILVKKVLGVSLDELGISLINIRSTGFRNVAVLFHNARIRKRCGIITDLDAAFIDTTPDPSDSPATQRAKARARGAQTAGLARRVNLSELGTDNPWLDSFFATHTFEVDFITAGNASKVVGMLNQVYKDAATISASKIELESKHIGAYGRRVLTMAENAGKGWFALLVGKMIDHHTIIPDYILKALSFAHGPISTSIMFNILSYRLGNLTADPSTMPETVAAFQTTLSEFRNGALDLPGIRKAMLEAFPADEINNTLAGL
jgi:putative ATP-dependent endonuclease of the OLD family